MITNSIDHHKSIQCNFKHTGSIKTLLDGECRYVGIDKNGNFVKLKLVKFCTRGEHQELLFI